MANSPGICFTSRGAPPCKGCPDRYPACSDHCKKPEFLKWRAEKRLVAKNRRAYEKELWGHTEDVRKRYRKK